MSRTDTAGERSLEETFRARLDEIGVESTIVAAPSLAAELEDRIDEPAVASPIGVDVSLPENVIEEPTGEEVKRAATGITAGQLGVASQGSVVVASTVDMDGPVSLYPPKHVAVVRVEDIVPDIGTALERLSREFERGANDAVFVTGPSSTGDMGKLVTGVHGPSEMEVVIVE